MQFRVGESGVFQSTGSSSFIYDANVSELLKEDVTLYLRSGKDDLTVTPFHIILNNQPLKMKELRTKYKTEYNSVDVTKGIPSGFPKAFEFAGEDSVVVYSFNVSWKPNEAPARVGKQEYYPVIATDGMADLSDVTIPNITVTYVKGSQEAPTMTGFISYKTTSTTILLGANDLPGKAIYITKAGDSEVLKDSGLCEGTNFTFDGLEPGTSYDFFAYLPETDLKKRSDGKKIDTCKTKGVLVYDGATAMNQTVGDMLPKKLSFIDKKTGEKKDYEVAWKLVSAPNGGDAGGLPVAGTYVFTATADVIGYDPVTIENITVKVSKKAIKEPNFDKVCKVTWVGTNTITVECLGNDADKFESIVLPTGETPADDYDGGLGNGEFTENLTKDSVNTTKDWSIWIRIRETNATAASPWVEKQVKLADDTVEVTSVTCENLPEGNLPYTKGVDNAVAFARQFPTSMTAHAGGYSKTIDNLTWHVKPGSKADGTPVSGIDSLDAGNYTFVPDVWGVKDVDNLGFSGAVLPEISVTVNDASSGENP